MLAWLFARPAPRLAHWPLTRLHALHRSCHPLPQGRPLTEVINETHENPKYMPGVGLGTNVVATPDLTKAVEGADVIVLCVAHQYMRQTVKKLAGKVRQGVAGRCRAGRRCVASRRPRRKRCRRTGCTLQEHAPLSAASSPSLDFHVA